MLTAAGPVELIVFQTIMKPSRTKTCKKIEANYGC